MEKQNRVATKQGARKRKDRIGFSFMNIHRYMYISILTDEEKNEYNICFVFKIKYGAISFFCF